MKTRLPLLSSLVAVLALGSLALTQSPATVSAAPSTYQVDGGHTAVLFRVNHLGVSNTWGRFNDVSGSFTWDADNPESATVKVKIAAESIDTNSDARDGHLKGPDFFNVAQFPTITFESTRVSKTSSPKHVDVSGNLTLHGVTKAVTVRLELIGEKDAGEKFGYRVGFDGSVTIKRSEYGMDKMLGLLGNDVRITLAFEGVRQ